MFEAFFWCSVPPFNAQCLESFFQLHGVFNAHRQKEPNVKRYYVQSGGIQRRVLPCYQNEVIKILNISFTGVGIKLTITAVLLCHDYFIINRTSYLNITKFQEFNYPILPRVIGSIFIENMKIVLKHTILWFFLLAKK